jgi:hypothetical protein
MFRQETHLTWKLKERRKKLFSRLALVDINQIVFFSNVCVYEKGSICLSTLRRITTSEMNSFNCREKKNQKAIRYSFLSFFFFFTFSTSLIVCMKEAFRLLTYSSIQICNVTFACWEHLELKEQRCMFTRQMTLSISSPFFFLHFMSTKTNCLNS